MEIVIIKQEWFQSIFQCTCYLLNGYFIYQLFIHYVMPREKLRFKILLFLSLAFSSGMTIWFGDTNLILTFPIFLILTLICTEGNMLGRFSVIFTFFCMEMSVAAFLDNYVKGHLHHDRLRFILYPTLGRTVIFTAVFFFLKRKLPEKIVFLPQCLWKIILGLSLMPLCTLTAIISLAYGRYYNDAASVQSQHIGLVVLPFIFLVSFAILAAISALADHEQLERAKQLSEMREAYYQNLQQQENSLRHMRHDMRNHLSTIRALLERNNTKEAVSYLDDLLDGVHPARMDMEQETDCGTCIGNEAEAVPPRKNIHFIQNVKRFCENEAANALLQTKVDLLLQNGLDFDFRVNLPEDISISDIDLCSLMGNALDNAIRAAASAADKTITLRCRCDKGIFMLMAVNCFSGSVDLKLKTTKPDRARHGFGISGMKEIAARYGGSLETQVEGHTFTLLVYLCYMESPG